MRPAYKSPQKHITSQKWSLSEELELRLLPATEDRLTQSSLDAISQVKASTLRTNSLGHCNHYCT